MNIARLLAIASLALCALLLACNKESGSAILRVRLTDGPADLDKVNIDLREVMCKMDRDTSAWVSLPTKRGIYNLLDLRNGVDTLIAEGAVGPGTVMEIRLVLGTNNTVEQQGTRLPLTIPSGSESGLKIKVAKQMRASLDSLIVDFDAGLSVKQEADGYKLRPVLRIK